MCKLIPYDGAQKRFFEQPAKHEEGVISGFPQFVKTDRNAIIAILGHQKKAFTQAESLMAGIESDREKQEVRRLKKLGRIRGKKV